MKASNFCTACAALLILLLSLCSKQANGQYDHNAGLHPLFLNDPSTATSCAVGEIPINYSLSPNGAAMYNIPIEILPGRNGFQPNISLVYNSQAGNGVMAPGWGISGLSAISNVDKSIYYDGYTEGVSFSKHIGADKASLSLDGMRLLQEDNTTKRVYIAEQGEVRVVPDPYPYFIAYRPNGEVARYGYEDGAKDKLSYPITRVEDILGNYIDYSYTYRNGHYYIDRIDYGACASFPSHFASIRFYYTTRSDVKTAYVDGLEIKEDYLLSRIECYSESQLQRKYTFTYGNSSNYLVLRQVDCEAYEKNLLPLYFSYDSPSGCTTQLFCNGEIQLPYNYVNSFDPYQEPTLLKGKMPSRADNDFLLVYPYGMPYTFGPDLHLKRYPENMAIHYYGNALEDNPHPASLISGKGFTTAICADIDNAYGDEILKVNNYLESAAREKIVVSVYKPDGKNLSLRNQNTFYTEPLNWRDSVSVTPKSFFTGDFNGDGKMELLSIDLGTPGLAYPCPNVPIIPGTPQCVALRTYQVRIYNLDEGASNFAFESCVIQYNPSKEEVLLPFDYNGDGKTDLLHTTEDGYELYTFTIAGGSYTSLNKVSANFPNQPAEMANLSTDRISFYELLLGDYNGDGNTDILLMPKHEAYGNGTLYLSKGDGSFKRTDIPVGTNLLGNKYYAQDVNGDGLTDVVVHSKGIRAEYGAWPPSETSCLLSCGDTFCDSRPIIGLPNDIQWISAGTGIARGSSSFMVLCGSEKNTLLNVNTSDDVLSNRLLTRVVNSMGVVAELDYKRLNTKEYEISCSSAPKTYSYPFREFKAPMCINTNRKVSVGKTVVEQTRNCFQNPVMHLQGLGFCGFEKMVVHDELRQTEVSQTFDPLRKGVLVAEESIFEKKAYSYFYKLGANKRPTIQLTKQTLLNKLTGLTTTTTFDLYDSFGYPEWTTVQYADGQRLITQTWYENAYSPLLGLPWRQWQTAYDGKGNEWEICTSRLYNENGMLIRQTRYVNDNDDKTSRIEYSYDACGNLIEERANAYNSPDWLVTAYDYDSNRRFVTNTTNPMGLATTYTYDKTKALLKTATDHKGNTTSYNAYDALGRLLETRNPDGTISKTRYEWAIGSSNQLYRVVSDCLSADGTQVSPTSAGYYDALNREVRSSSQGFNGTDIFVDTRYDSFGRVQKKSEPYPAGSQADRWEEITYDIYNRPTTVSSPTGRTITYTYGKNSVTTNDMGIVTTRQSDALGQLVQVSDPGGTIRYTYRADGQPLTITAPGGAVTTFEYDDFGRQAKLVDPSAGTLSYTYDAAGNLNSQTNARGQTENLTFNQFGQLRVHTSPEMTTVYSYNPQDYSLTSIVSSNGTAQRFTYDNLGRTLSETEEVGAEQLTTTYRYAGNQLVSADFSPLAGRPLSYQYNAYGYLSTLKLANGPAIWQLQQTNERGQPERELLGNGLSQTYSYTANGFPQERKVVGTTGTQQHLTYSFNEAKGLLNARANGLRGVSETFGYDGLKRLTSYNSHVVGYNNMGNITVKDDAGSLSYNIPGKPYAISEQKADNQLKTKRVRYIRDWLNGNSVNFWNHWVEIQAIGEDLSTNLALGKPIVGDCTDIGRITDGRTDVTLYTDYSNGLKSVTVDLGAAHNVSTVKVWHYYGDGRSYHGAKTQVSEDGISWVDLFDSAADGEYVETAAGRTYSTVRTQTIQGRYVRDWLYGNSVNNDSHWVEMQVVDKCGVNLALGKPVTGSINFAQLELVTDGSTSTDPYVYDQQGRGQQQYVTVDLGQVRSFNAVKVWHYYGDGRSYHGTRTQVSEDGLVWTDLFNSAVDGEYQETASGRTYSITNPPATPPREQLVSYASFDRPLSIEENGYRAEFGYNTSGDRRKMTLSHNNLLQLTRYYLSNCYEKDVSDSGTVTQRLYLGGTAYDAPAVWVKEGDTEKIYYIHRDHLGSITQLSDETGAKVDEYSYDAWGRLRNPQSLQAYGPDGQPTLLLGRGYTGHEHLPWFGLVNMNARLYDPVLGRFLGPDPYVQMPDFTQNFNRYSYCLNNPLMYVDPTGEQMADPQFLLNEALIVGRYTGTGSVPFYTKLLEERYSLARYNHERMIRDDDNRRSSMYLAGSRSHEELRYLLDHPGLRKELVHKGLLSMDDRELLHKMAIRYGTQGFVTHPLTQATAEMVAFVLTGGIEGVMSLGSALAKAVAKNVMKIVAKEGVQAAEYTFTKTAAKHLTDIVTKGASKGQLARPYMNSPLTIQEIMSTGKGALDATYKGGMNWTVPGTFRGSQGIYQLGINPNTNVIYHFNFIH